MIDVVFSDSEKVALELAKENNRENHLEISSKSSVVSLGFFLDYGDISKEMSSFSRKEVLEELWVGKDHTNEDITIYLEEKDKELNTLIASAKDGIEIRVWKSNGPYAVCGFAYLCYLLRDIKCKITEITLPVLCEDDNNLLVAYSNWSEINPKSLHNFLSLKREVCHTEKLYQSNIWRNLMKENSPLRAVVNGALLSVQEDFYDDLIIRNIPSCEFRMVELVGKLIGEYRLGLSDSFYAIRINKLIEERYLEVISTLELPYPYSLILKKI